LTTTSSDYEVPASDPRGHSVPVSFRLPGNVLQDLDDTISIRITPFISKSDFLRWATVYGLKHLKSIGPVVGIRKRTQAVLDIMRDEEISGDFQTVFERLKSQVDDLEKKGHHRLARRLASRAYNQIKAMPEEDDWTKVWIDEFEGRFGNLLDESRTVGLLDTVADAYPV
jgi:hypothetical protein